MRQFIHPAAILMIGMGAASLARGESTQSAWTPIFTGVEHATGQTTIDAQDNHLEKVNAIRVDLLADGVSFYSTPHSGSNETDRQVTTAFLEQHDLQVAVNANFFQPSGALYSPGSANLSGLAMSDGNVVSPAGDGYLPSLVIGVDNAASLVSADVGFNTAGVFTAVAGSVVVLNDGVIAPFAPEYLTLAPRTGVGLSADSRYLYIVTIDGRQPGVSEGATFNDLGEWLNRFGAYDGINLDGGGSTALARDDGSGNAVLLNVPCGDGSALRPPGTERYNGNHLGIRAAPLPEPGSGIILLLPAAMLARNHRRHD